MSTTANDNDTKREPSPGPLKNEPTPEKAKEQKERQSERAGGDKPEPGQRAPSES